LSFSAFWFLEGSQAAEMHVKSFVQLILLHMMTGFDCPTKYRAGRGHGPFENGADAGNLRKMAEPE